MLMLILGSVNANLNTDLEVYYNFDETSGTTLTDSVGSKDGTASAGDILDSSAGILGTSGNFIGTDSDNIIYDGTIVTDYPFTHNAWIKSNNGAGQIMGLINKGANTEYSNILLQASQFAEAQSYFGGSNGKATYSVDIADNAWHMITGLFISDTNRCVAVDGLIRICE
ncbi:unnamed protein product, partial [marine sediment metagenome]